MFSEVFECGNCHEIFSVTLLEYKESLRKSVKTSLEEVCVEVRCPKCGDAYSGVPLPLNKRSIIS
jgi:hypothetical protein